MVEGENKRIIMKKIYCKCRIERRMRDGGSRIRERKERKNGKIRTTKNI